MNAVATAMAEAQQPNDGPPYLIIYIGVDFHVLSAVGAGRFPLAKPVEPAAQGFVATEETVAPPAKVTIHRGIGKGRPAFFFC